MLRLTLFWGNPLPQKLVTWDAKQMVYWGKWLAYKHKYPGPDPPAAMLKSGHVSAQQKSQCWEAEMGEFQGFVDWLETLGSHWVPVSNNKVMNVEKTIQSWPLFDFYTCTQTVWLHIHKCTHMQHIHTNVGDDGEKNYRSVPPFHFWNFPFGICWWKLVVNSWTKKKQNVREFA